MSRGRKSTAIRRQRRDKTARKWPDTGHKKARFGPPSDRAWDRDTIDNDHRQGGRHHG